MHCKKLYPHQVSSTLTVLDALAHQADVLVEKPTGSGKTVEVIAVAAELNRLGRKVLIATPQEQIEENFVKRDWDRVECQGQVIPVLPAQIQAARDADVIKDRLTAFIENPHAGHVLVCTHQALTRLKPPTALPADLHDLVLLVDEAHHIQAPVLGAVAQVLHTRGARIGLYTATAYRGDGRPVALPHMLRVCRSLPQHMEEGYAPAKIAYGVNAVRAGTPVTKQQFHGNEAPAEVVQAQIARELGRAWEQDGRPQTIIRVPPVRGGSQAFVQRVIAELQQRGARVLDVSGEDPAKRQAMLAALVSERGLPSAQDSQYDVLVGIQRVMEGMDWPWCSTVYCVGLPKAIATIVQLLGRATRRKPAGYPAEHRDRALLRFFVPCKDTDTLRGMPAYHAQHALLTCAYLANSEAGEEWSLVRDLGRGLIASLGAGKAVHAVAESMPYVDPKIRAEITAVVYAAKQDLRKAGCGTSWGSVFNHVKHAQPHLSHAVLETVIVEMMAAENTASRSAMMRQLRDSVRDYLGEGTPLREAICQAFHQVLEEFHDATLVHSESLSLFERHLHDMHAKTVRRFARKLNEARPLHPRELACWVQRHKRQHKKFPAGDTPGGPDGRPGESWKNVDRAIRQGGRSWHLPGCKDLADFCQHYVHRRLIGDRLAQFRGEHVLSPAAVKLLAHLGRTKVRFPGQEGEVGWATLLDAPSNWRGAFAWLHGLCSPGFWPALGPVPLLFAADLVRQLMGWLARQHKLLAGIDHGVEKDARRFATRCVRKRAVLFSPQNHFWPRPPAASPTRWTRGTTTWRGWSASPRPPSTATGCTSATRTPRRTCRPPRPRCRWRRCPCARTAACSKRPWGTRPRPAKRSLTRYHRSARPPCRRPGSPTTSTTPASSWRWTVPWSISSGTR